jgi:hypothetical protein
MALTDEQVEQYISKVKDTITEAQKELAEVKIVSENDPTEYSHVMQQLLQLNDDMGDYLDNATPKQKEDLDEARKYIQYTQEIMNDGI